MGEWASGRNGEWARSVSAMKWQNRLAQGKAAHKLALKGQPNVRLTPCVWAQMVPTGPTPTISNEDRREDD